jgi:hypothetical protein
VRLPLHLLNSTAAYCSVSMMVVARQENTPAQCDLYSKSPAAAVKCSGAKGRGGKGAPTQCVVGEPGTWEDCGQGPRPPYTKRRGGHGGVCLLLQRRDVARLKTAADWTIGSWRRRLRACNASVRLAITIYSQRTMAYALQLSTSTYVPR